MALRCLFESGAPHELTYSELAKRSSRLASALASLGIGRGEGARLRAHRADPQLYIAVLGGLKLGAVVSTLSVAFGHNEVKGMTATPSAGE